MTSRPPCRTSRANAARTGATLAAGAVMLAALGGCSGGDDVPAPAEPGSATSPSAADAPVAADTQVVIGTITGRLPKQQRDGLVRAIEKPIDGWFDAAYLEGDRPRPGVRSAFPSFTAGAAARARGDRAVMSNARLPRDVDAVHVTSRRARIDVLAVDRRPVGVTARFSVAMDLQRDQARTRRERVSGRLFLRFTDGEWRIFGYDADRSGL